MRRRLLDRMLRVLVVLGIGRVGHHPLRVDWRFVVAIVWRRCRGAGIAVEQLRRALSLPRLVLRGYILRVLTGMWWWEAHRLNVPTEADPPKRAGWTRKTARRRVG
jgi:hypothetical protein